MNDNKKSPILYFVLAIVVIIAMIVVSVLLK